jgi:hypothetical protein
MAGCIIISNLIDDNMSLVKKLVLVRVEQLIHF